MDIYKKKLIQYTIQQSDKALEKAESFLQNDYLTNVTEKLMDAMLNILLALAYYANYIPLSKNDISDDVFWIWKSHKDKLTNDQHDQFMKWFKQYAKQNLPKNVSLYNIYNTVYRRNLEINSGPVNNLTKEELIKDLEQAKLFIMIIKKHITGSFPLI